MRKLQLFVAGLALFACDLPAEVNEVPRAKPSQPTSPKPSRTPIVQATVGGSSTGSAKVEKSDDVDDAPKDPEPEPPIVPVDLALDETRPPADYGLIHPSDPAPDPASLTVHALAGYEVVAIYDRPDITSRKLGYLRIGQRVMVTPKIEGGGCSQGFHQLREGGYACANKGLVVDPKRPPYMFRPPPPPHVEGNLPYQYAFVHKWNSPMWWRIPTADELGIAKLRRDVLETERLGATLPENGSLPQVLDPFQNGPDGSTAPIVDAGREAATMARTEPGSSPRLLAVNDPVPGDRPPSEPAVAPPPPPPPVPVPENSDGSTGTDPAVSELELPLAPQDPWLERGFFISLAEKMTESSHGWWRTARGAYVATEDASTYTPKDFHGVVLAEDADFPFAFVMGKEGATTYVLSDNGRLKKADRLDRRTLVELVDETEVAGHTYMLTVEGQLVRKSDLRLAERQPLPEGLLPWERWIDVDLDKQLLVAYEGEKPVFTTLVSTGRRGTPEEPFETPTGRWRIRSKHVSSTMDGNTASDGAYSIQDVPWAMFFEGSFALHGAFWHDRFGQARSHGCVNLGPTDARWLFYWTTPFLPEGWHGVHAHDGSPGTTVVIRKPSL